MVGWPAVIWVESGQFSSAFLDGDLATAACFEQTLQFDDVQEIVPNAPADRAPKKAARMYAYAGHATICDLGRVRLVIVLFNYDRGVLKYDLQPADDAFRLTLQPAADAVNQRPVGHYQTHSSRKGHPTDIKSFVALHGAGEAVVSSVL